MKLSSLIALGLLALTTPPLLAQSLVNGGFEDPITYDGAPFVGSWEGFNAGAGSLAANSAAMPRTGTQNLELSIFNTDNSFAGVFQDVLGVIPGTDYILGGWHATPSSPFDVGAEVRIEWRNSVSNTEVSRTPNLTPLPTASYSAFSLTATAPAGADLARVVYAIQSFGPEPSNNGTVYVDDMSFAAVPEPSTLLLLGVGGLALISLRRRLA